MFRINVVAIPLTILLTGCSVFNTPDPSAACPVTEPVWVLAPADPAVDDPPAYGYFFVNEDRSIWASAGWAKSEEFGLRVSEGRAKVGWFRPAGVNLEIAGRRIDGEAQPLQFHIPCCYPTRFQASGLYFPAAGCWEVTAKAGEGNLSFVVWVDP